MAEMAADVEKKAMMVGAVKAVVVATADVVNAVGGEAVEVCVCAVKSGSGTAMRVGTALRALV